MHIAVTVVYLLAMLWIGVVTSKETHDIEDFFVASRRLPLWVNVNTIAATYIGAGATMGIAGMVYRSGIGGTAILVFQVGAMVLLALLLAERLWETKAITLPDVVETLYDLRTREIVTVLRLISIAGVVGGQMLAMALIAQVILGGASFQLALIIMGGVIIAYTVMGGLLAVALTDVVQMILNALGVMVILPWVGLKAVGGLAGLQKALPAARFDFFSVGSSFLFLMFVFAVPGTFTAQELWVRLFAAESPKKGKLALILAALTVYLPYAISVAVIGLVGAAMFPGVTSDKLIPVMLDKLAPGFLASVCLASLLAAVMSCADSVLLVAGSNVARDVYQRFMNPNASTQQVLLVSRVSVVGMGIIGMLLAASATGIIDLMTTVATPLAAVGPIILFGFYWKKASPAGAQIAIITAILLSIPTLFFKVKILNQEPLVVTTVGSTIAVWLGSLLMPAKPKAQETAGASLPR